MKEKNAELLARAISRCISGPGGDPISDTLFPASLMFEVLKDEGFEHLVDKETIDALTGNNIEECNYLDRLGYPDYYEET